MVIKMDTIDGAHAANAINYVLDKEKARKEDKPVFLTSNNIELNPLTGKPYSPVAVLMDMQLLLATSRHKADEPFWRIELCPPPEVCRNWTMAQWDKFCKDCVQVLDATDYKREAVKDKDGKTVIDKRTGKPKVKVSGKHTMLANSQYVATVHFDTGKPHVHIVANRLTMDGEMQDTHKCKEHAKTAANIIAEKYGWTKAEERENKRMERIHSAAMKVLKGMDAWDIETYFAGMRRNGFEVEPTYDSKGVCRGYSIGERLYDLDGNYSSTVMYKASAKGFGHGRDITVSKLPDTWQKMHPVILESEPRNIEEHPRVTRIEVETKDEKTVNEQPMSKPKPNHTVNPTVTAQPTQEPAPRKSTEAESDRRTAVWLALNAIKRFVKSPFRTEFSPLDKEDILPEGIVAKAIYMGEREGSSFSEENLKSAAMELLDQFECSAERAGEAAEVMLDVVANLALPETQPSLGGGQSNNDLPKKKDEEWYWWKKNGFIRQQNYRGRKR